MHIRGKIKKSSIRMLCTSSRYFNQFWEFHLTDADWWPSVPHGHSIKSNRMLKLDVYTGNVYDPDTRDTVGVVRKKDLKSLISEPNYFNFEMRAVENFRQTNPVLYRKFNYPRREYHHMSLRLISSGDNEPVTVCRAILGVRYIDLRSIGLSRG